MGPSLAAKRPAAACSSLPWPAVALFHWLYGELAGNPAACLPGRPLWRLFGRKRRLCCCTGAPTWLSGSSSKQMWRGCTPAAGCSCTLYSSSCGGEGGAGVRPACWGASAQWPRRQRSPGCPRSRRASSACSAPTPHTPAPGRGPTLRRGRRRLFSCGVEMILLSMRCSATRSHSYLWGGGWGVACGAGAVTGTGNGTIAVAPRAVQAGPRMQGAGMRRGKQGRRRRSSRPGVCTPPCPAAQRSHPICPSYCSSASQRPSPYWCHTSAPL